MELVELWNKVRLYKNKYDACEFLRRNYVVLCNQLQKEVLFATTVVEALYCKVHNISTPPVCPRCLTHKLSFDIRSLEYKEVCSVCSRRATSLQRYGVEHPMKYAPVKEKCISSTVQRLGHHHFQDPLTKERIKHSWLEKYGTNHPMKNARVLEKARATNLRKYGVENPMQMEVVKQKVRDTCLEKYGSNLWKHPTVRAKVMATCLSKYGVAFSMQSPSVREKVRSTFLQRYGVAPATKSVKYVFEFIRREVERHKRFDVVSDLRRFEYTQEVELRCKNCRQSFVVYRSTADVRCPYCYQSQKSKLEEEFASWLRCIGVSFRRNVRDVLTLDSGKRFEVDFWIDNYKVGIELDGLYWHSEIYVDKYYHYRKQDAAREKGVRLLQVFEDEWTLKQDIVKSVVLHALGLSDKRVDARRCEIVLLDQSNAIDFHNRYHLRGGVYTKYHLGLVYNGDVLMVASFDRSRFHKDPTVYELVRVTSVPTVIVRGGVGKLVNSFLKLVSGCSSLVTYVDRRLFVGKSMTSLGFSLRGVTPPGYYYISLRDDPIVRYYRVHFQKHKLKKLFPDLYSEGCTEEEIMRLAGYARVWDAGNYVFVIVR